MLKQKPTIKPPVITIVAPSGMGKTTLGGLFPAPVFIQAEDAETVFEDWETPPMFMPQLPRASRNPDNTMRASTKETLLEQLRWLIANDHDRETVVFDTVSTLNKMLEHELCVREGVENIADAAGGYAKGYLVIAEWHAQIRDACEHLRKKGMTIVFLSHVAFQKIKSRPDIDEYTVFNLDIHEKSIPVYVNLSDCVLYIKKGAVVSGKETNKKGQVTKFGRYVDTGERVIVTSCDGLVGYVNAKSRYSMPQEIKLEHGENPIMEYIPFYNMKGVSDEV